MVTWNIDSSRTALLVVDLQNLFVENYEPISAPDGLEIVERLNRLADTCRASGIPVVYAAHALRTDLSNIGQMASMFPVMVTDNPITTGSETAAMHPGFRVEEADIYLEKPRFGAFTATDLELILRGRGIDTVIIGGIATNICCETTAREANHREFKVIFLHDGTTTAGYADMGWGELTPEEVKKATLTTLAYAFAEVAGCDDVARRIADAVDTSVTPITNSILV
jgi:nicotinamidase-related amidase